MSICSLTRIRRTIGYKMHIKCIFFFKKKQHISKFRIKSISRTTPTTIYQQIQSKRWQRCTVVNRPMTNVISFQTTAHVTNALPRTVRMSNNNHFVSIEKRVSRVQTLRTHSNKRQANASLTCETIYKHI